MFTYKWSSCWWAIAIVYTFIALHKENRKEKQTHILYTHRHDNRQINLLLWLKENITKQIKTFRFLVQLHIKITKKKCWKM